MFNENNNGHIIKFNSLDSYTISSALEKLQVKHVTLNDGIVVLGRYPTIKIKGKIIYQGAIFSTNSARENLYYSASVVQQIPELIERLADLSRLVEDKENLDTIKHIIKAADTIEHNFKVLVNHLSRQK